MNIGLSSFRNLEFYGYDKVYPVQGIELSLSFDETVLDRCMKHVSKVVAGDFVKSNKICFYSDKLNLSLYFWDSIITISSGRPKLK